MIQNYTETYSQYKVRDEKVTKEVKKKDNNIASDCKFVKNMLYTEWVATVT